MPPVISRKRLRSDSPNIEPQPKRARASRPPARRGKESVFQTLDAAPKVKRTLSQTKALLEQEDDNSELSELDSSDDEFEDVPLHGANKGKGGATVENSDDSADDDWEDALRGHDPIEHGHGPVPVITGDIALTLSAAPKTAFDTKPDGKKGPSKIQRQIRNATHCMHVQYLMFHNLTRNAWIQDKEVQTILVEALPSACWAEVDRYWTDAGIPQGSARAIVKRRGAPTSARPAAKETNARKNAWKESATVGVKTYASPQGKYTTPQQISKKPARGKIKETAKVDRNARDWGATSERLEPTTPNLSAGDPLMRLLRYCSAYWKSRFRVTAPSLRKRGYLSPATLEAELNAWKETPLHANTFGERIDDLEAFRQAARRCEGSRDVGEQLFTALLRGLGIEARMVVSLQPIGFGFSQAEEGKPKNLAKLNVVGKNNCDTAMKVTSETKNPSERASTHNLKQSLGDGASEDSDLSSVISISSDTDEDKPLEKTPKVRNYVDELPYPTYWTEAISNLTHTPISVSPLPRMVIASASSPDKLQDFYTRGAIADKARQVFAYLIAFSSDGTAKDVTTRYLPKRQWPGRTKGFRLPIEKIPIHNKRGKVKRWEEWDWFKSLMRPYARPHSQRQSWDEVEEEGDLVSLKPDKKKTVDEEGGKESLQGYKSSVEYVLERHLRREEALKPDAKVVRQFVTGKGDKEKSEPVYRRKDIVNCKTVESWHKEGLEVKQGQQPLKFVPMRAVTVTRKREIEERERNEGIKPTQGLYSRAQTNWIIPPPIVDGKIPRNAFDNIDVYVPTMVPQGAVHIPLKGTARICRKLQIEYAEACTGFEFGKQRAVPVLTGVVVAAENENIVIDTWEIEEAEKAKKAAEKREKLVLSLWKKFLGGLLIVERMRTEFGEDVELPVKKAEPAPGQKFDKEMKTEWEVFQSHDDFEGGFVREDGPSDGGFIRQKQNHTTHDEVLAGDLIVASQEGSDHGDLVIDLGDQKKSTYMSGTETSYQTPISLTSAVQQPNDRSDDFNDCFQAIGVDQSDHTGDRLPPKLSKHSKSALSNPANDRGRGHTDSLPSAIMYKHKSLYVDSSEAEEDSLFSERTTKPPTLPTPSRSQPKRKAACKSNAQVKSHFFAEESHGETDLTDMTDRVSPRKARARGKSKGRRGGGRGRGKVKA